MSETLNPVREGVSFLVHVFLLPLKVKLFDAFTMNKLLQLYFVFLLATPYH